MKDSVSLSRAGPTPGNFVAWGVIMLISSENISTYAARDIPGSVSQG
jgi:hypothetical protein